MSCLRTAPFWATISVGISSGAATVFVTFLVTFIVLPWRLTATRFFTVSFFVGLQTFVIAANAENLLVGTISSNVLKG